MECRGRGSWNPGTGGLDGGRGPSNAAVWNYESRNTVQCDIDDTYWKLQKDDRHSEGEIFPFWLFIVYTISVVQRNGDKGSLERKKARRRCYEVDMLGGLCIRSFDNKVSCNHEATNKLLGGVVLDEIVEFGVSSDGKALLLGKDIPDEHEKVSGSFGERFHKVAKAKIIRRRRKTTGKKLDDNVKVDNVKEKGKGKEKEKQDGCQGFEADNWIDESHGFQADSMIEETLENSGRR
ncbi:hypothetical protein AKJ16_DCAP12299 [Drosera capensis]